MVVSMRNVVRQRRVEMGLSQTQLACRVGLAQSTLSNIELGKLEPWPRVRRDLATALDCAEEELFRTQTPARR
jgi:transcriptional regulator with XRE-family HTH domain